MSKEQYAEGEVTVQLINEGVFIVTLLSLPCLLLNLKGQDNPKETKLGKICMEDLSDTFKTDLGSPEFLS